MTKERWSDFISRCEREIGFYPLAVLDEEDGLSYLVEMGDEEDLLSGSIVSRRGELYLVFVGDHEGEGETYPEEYLWVDLSGTLSHPGERVVVECELCDWERSAPVTDYESVTGVLDELDLHVEEVHS